MKQSERNPEPINKEIKEYVKQRVKRKFDRNKNDQRSLHVIKTEWESLRIRRKGIKKMDFRWKA